MLKPIVSLNSHGMHQPKALRQALQATSSIGLSGDRLTLGQPGKPVFGMAQPDLVSEIKHMSEDIKAEKHRKIYKELYHIQFHYGQNLLNALNILEVVYKRDTLNPKKGLTADYFAELSDGTKNQFFNALKALVDKNLLTETKWTEDDGQGDLIRITYKNGKETEIQTTYTNRITDLGKKVVEQYAKDSPEQRDKALGINQRKTNSNDEAKTKQLKALLGITPWGMSGLAVLKALTTQWEERPWYTRMLGLGISEAALRSALGIPPEKSDSPLSLLETQGLLIQQQKYKKTWFQPTRVGIEAVKTLSGQNGGLLENGFVTTEDMKNLLKSRIDEVKTARKELGQLIEKFESAYQTALSDVESIQQSIQTMEAEARKLFAQSKSEALSQEDRLEKEEEAVNQKKQAQQTQKLLEEEKIPALEQATQQWNAAQEIDLKISQKLDTQLKQAQKDEVFLQAAILQNNLLDFVSHWTQDEAVLQNPIFQLREELSKKWEAQEVSTDSAEAIVVKRVLKRLKLKEEEELRQQLESDFKASTANDVPARKVETLVAESRKTQKSAATAEVD